MRKIFLFLIFINMVFASEDLLRALQLLEESESKEERARVERFSKDRANQAKLLNDVKRELDALKKESDRLSTIMENNEKKLTHLESQLKDKSSILGEFFGVIKESVLEFKAHIDDSIISGELKDRKKELDFVDKANVLPKKEQIENYWQMVLLEIVKGGEVKQFDAVVVNQDGEKESKKVTRVGAFALLSDGDYLFVDNENLYTHKTQPTSAKKYENSSGYEELTIDPTRGSLINILDKKISFSDRMKEGGIIGYFILILGAIGVVVGAFRVYVLFIANRKIENQIKNPQNIDSNNALGRVMIARKNGSYEEAITKEYGELSKGLGLIKLLAAVAPLLGLLGTVVGMIETFEAITIFGTNDPKLMAGGISLALVTTMQGLIVAVPLLFIHAFLNEKSNEMLDRIEYESCGTDS